MWYGIGFALVQIQGMRRENTMNHLNLSGGNKVKLNSLNDMYDGCGEKPKIPKRRIFPVRKIKSGSVLMVSQRYFLMTILSFLLAGCAGMYERQSPAPVYRKQTSRYIPQAPVPGRPTKPSRPSQAPPPVVRTQPLKEFNQALVPLAAPPQMISPGTDMTEDSMPQAAFPETGVKETELPPYSAPGSGQLPQVPKQETFELTPFQPIEPPASLSPAVGALVLAANEYTKKGNIDTAAASLDRALKIEPRNPALYYKLALVRLKQSKPQEAENLAKKSALLAAGDRQLKKHSWLLIAHAREMQRDFKGAQQARAKAESF